MEDERKGRITPEKAMEILEKNGLQVSAEQAGLVLDFLYKLANVAVTQYLKNENG